MKLHTDGTIEGTPEEVGQVSDGYHTFDELYEHRATLFAAVCRAYPAKAWKSLLHDDGTMFDGGYFIVGIETPEGQFTYHYTMKYWDMFAVKELDKAPEWDGHTATDVTRLLALDKDFQEFKGRWNRQEAGAGQ